MFHNSPENSQVFILICLASMQLKTYVLSESLTIMGIFIIHITLVSTAQNFTLSSNKANRSKEADVKYFYNGCVGKQIDAEKN